MSLFKKERKLIRVLAVLVIVFLLLSPSVSLHGTENLEVSTEADYTLIVEHEYEPETELTFSGMGIVEEMFTGGLSESDFSVQAMETVVRDGKELLLVSLASNDGTSRILSYEGDNWSEDALPGFAHNNTVVTSLLAVNNVVYAGTANHKTGAEIWTYTDGVWELSAIGGFGKGSANYAVSELAQYRGEVYAGVSNIGDGAEVWKKEHDKWVKINQSGFADLVPSGQSTYPAANPAITSMAVYDNKLYAGTLNLGGTFIFAYDGASWTQVNSSGFGKDDIESQCGLNIAATSMEVFEEKLYVGTVNLLAKLSFSLIPKAELTSRGGEIWSFDGDGWVQDVAGGISDPGNWGFTSLKTHEGELFAGSVNPRISVVPDLSGFFFPSPKARGIVRLVSGGASLLSFDGENWSVLGSDGFGDKQNVAVTSLQIYDGKLLTGTANICKSEFKVEINNFLSVPAIINEMMKKCGLEFVGTLSADLTPLAPFPNTNGSSIFKYTVVDPSDLFVIKSSAGEGGAIKPEGMLKISEGGSMTFNIIPDAGYKIADILIDGESMGAVAWYTFMDVSADHSIHADFELRDSEREQEQEYVLYGDISLNGSVAIDDAILILRYIAGLIDFTVPQIEAASVRGDGVVTVADAILLLRYVVGLIDVFPAEYAAY